MERRAFNHTTGTIANEAAQIDAIAMERGWFRNQDGNVVYKSIKGYMADTLDLKTLLEIITIPIDQGYTSADNGHAIFRTEVVAADQRQYWSVDEARERWGEPLPNDKLPAKVAEPATLFETGLWELWYSILHVARRTSWHDTAAQHKLLAVVQALKAHPNPPPPALMTKALQNDWMWGPGVVWSKLLMLYPAARETWNECPRDRPNISELHAWTNLNAFVARLTVAGLADFWLYAIWAMRDALEDEHQLPDQSNRNSPDSGVLDAHVAAPAAWVILLGKEMWQRERDLTPRRACEGNPARGGGLWKGKAEFSKARYEFWAKRFKELSKDVSLLQETKDLAEEAVNIMEAAMQT